MKARLPLLEEETLADIHLMTQQGAAREPGQRGATVPSGSLLSVPKHMFL